MTYSVTRNFFSSFFFRYSILVMAAPVLQPSRPPSPSPAQTAGRLQWQHGPHQAEALPQRPPKSPPPLTLKQNKKKNKLNKNNIDDPCPSPCTPLLLPSKTPVTLPSCPKANCCLRDPENYPPTIHNMAPQNPNDRTLF